MRKRGRQDTRAAIHARVSSERQDVELSISAQLKALREYATKSGHEVVREYVDEAESGRTSQRPAFMEMVAAAKRKDRPFHLILVWKYSRFARSREDSIVFKTMLRKCGVQVLSVNEPTDNSPTGRLLEAMIESPGHQGERLPRLLGVAENPLRLQAGEGE